MGTAWKVLDRLSGREVCLKRPRARLGDGSQDGLVIMAESDGDLASAPTLMASSSESTGSRLDQTLDTGGRSGRLALAREFGVLAGLRHPGIVSVLDYGFDLSLEPYITMELVDGCNIVQAAMDLDQPGKVRLLVQMLEALAYVHHPSVIHRDVKPSNVMVAAEVVKLLDFGIAAPTSEVSTGEVAGTFGFIAPEMLPGVAPGTGSDVYSAGVIASLIRFDAPPSAVTETSALADVIRRMTATDPRDRPARARAAAGALAEAAGLTQPTESVEVREAYLTATDLVRRKSELSALLKTWNGAQSGRTAVRLVGGESGVGKSRLVSELRARALVERALVEGALVLRGHGPTAGSLFYNGWRDVAASLVLE
ncbi:MAG: serine/threonine protein kinase [Myxococcota bacterium]|jgi:serine/threonine protein kinase